MNEKPKDPRVDHTQYDRPLATAAENVLVPTVDELDRMLEALETYVEWHGGLHEDGCPEDDTCDCSFEYVNRGVNGAIRYIRAVERRQAALELAKAVDAVDPHV